MLVFQNLSFRVRLSIALGVAVLVFLVLPGSLHLETRLLATWAAGVSTFLGLLLVIMTCSTVESICDRARRHTVHIAIFGLNSPVQFICSNSLVPFAFHWG
jgi:hypothetical protein